MATTTERWAVAIFSEGTGPHTLLHFVFRTKEEAEHEAKERNIDFAEVMAHGDFYEAVRVTP